MNHPIHIPNELVDYWGDLYKNDGHMPEWILRHVATEAAQWGADQELQACEEWLERNYDEPPWEGHSLRAVRRPKPPSLRKQALEALAAIATGANKHSKQSQDLYTLRQALAELPD